MTVFFTSDTHYGHANIIGYAHRPYDDVREMNEAMIENWNSVVSPGDLVYHLGDFAFLPPEEATAIARRLNGNKYLVFGNHDKSLRRDPKFCGQWLWTKDLTEITVEGQKIILCHYAMKVWNKSHHGSWHLYGHSHGTIPDDPGSLSMDVGVDPNEFYPVTFEEVAKKMSKKTFKPVDRHGK